VLFRSLYLPATRFVALGPVTGTKRQLKVVTHQEYVDWVNDSMVRNGFFEREIHRSTHRFGDLAQVFSTYESRQTANGPVIERGINSIELVFDGARWWITAANWLDEETATPIPDEFAK